MLRALLSDLGPERDRVELVAYSTTQAMNALLEGDVARVGVVGIGAGRELRLARRRTSIGDVKLAPGKVLRTDHVLLDATRGLDDAAIDAALDTSAGTPDARRSPSAARSRSTRRSTSAASSERAASAGCLPAPATS